MHALNKIKTKFNTVKTPHFEQFADIQVTVMRVLKVFFFGKIFPSMFPGMDKIFNGCLLSDVSTLKLNAFVNI